MYRYDRLLVGSNIFHFPHQFFFTSVSICFHFTGAIEELVIEFEGEKYTIRDLAQINRKNPKLLALNFSNFPQTIPTVLQTLNESGMNLNPQQDGVSVFIPIPK